MRSIIGILITTAALVCTCCLGAPAGADSTILAIPFNDLLPPLLDNDAITNTTINTTTKAPITTTFKTTTTPAPISITKTITKTTKKEITTHSPPLLFKSTKKSYYQKQTEHIKELHLIDDDGLIPHDYSEQAEHLQNLHDEQKKEYQQQIVQQKLQKLQQEQSLKYQKQQKFQKVAKPLSVALETPQQVAASQTKKSFSSNVAKVNALKNDVEQTSSNVVEQVQATGFQILPKQQAQITVQHQNQNQPQRQHHQQHRFQAQMQPLDFNAFQQYFDFQHTTHRPPKSGLPTLTPFPRHLK